MDYLTPERQLRLVGEAESGDSGAFGTLYEHFQPAIQGHISGRLSNPQDVEDVSGECFLRALRAVRRGTFDPQYTFYTFLRGIADNEIKRFLKREYVQVPRPRANGKSGYVPKVLALPERGALPKDAWRMTDRILASLPTDDAEAVASELLRLVLVCRDKPHHKLAFCLVRFLEWRPREVVDQLSGSTLSEITHRIYDDFAVLFPGEEFAKEARVQHCPRFWSELDRLVADVYAEAEYERLCQAEGRKTGDLVLEVFYGPNPSASLSDWCDKARKRARKTAGGDMFHGS